MSNAYKLAMTTISTVAQQSDRAILFYSGGKDSIALLDMMAQQFKEVHVCFMYFVKGLRHCDKYLEFSQKRYDNIKIVQVPHFRLTSIRREGLFCNPEPNIKILSLSDIDKHIRAETGIDWSFYGMKKSDSLNRRLMLKSYGELPIQTTTKKVYPLADFKDGDVMRYIQKRKLPMPIKYGNKRSNAVGFDIDCMLWMRENEPADLEKVYQRFPKSRQILFEHDYHEQNKTSKV